MGKLSMARMLSLLLTFLLTSQSTTGIAAEAPSYAIGVLAKRGESITLQRWSATADYLTQQIEDARFRIVPLPFEAIEPAIQTQQIDFLLANSGIYIKAEHDFRAFRIATLINKVGDYGVNRFGGVIFTRKDNTALQRLSDLKGTRFGAVNPTSLGGFLMAKRELLSHEIDVDKETTLHFFGTHDAVVDAVIRGEVDAGTVRTDTLEQMSASGLVQLHEIKVLNLQTNQGFPYLISTQLYPEWPLAALPHTAKSLDEKVSIALLKMPLDHPAAVASRIFGWTVPANYEPVHELYRSLNIPPHKRLPPNLIEWTEHHPIATFMTLASVVLIIISLVLLSENNRRLRNTQQRLSQTIGKLKSTESKLKENLSQLQESENKFTQLAESALDGIIMLDPQGKIEFWNPAAGKIFGYTSEQAANLAIGQWLPSDQAENPILDSIGNGDTPLAGTLLELEAMRKSGERFPAEAAISSVTLDRGQHVICLIRDITQRKIIEAEREQLALQRTQHHKMTALAQLADGIAHEINTPIQTINNNLNFIEEAHQDSHDLISTYLALTDAIENNTDLSSKLETCNEKREEIDLDYLKDEVTTTIQQCLQGTEQVSRIVRSMRIFTSDSAVHEATDLNKLIRDIVSISRYQWEQIAELETDLDETLPLVTCSPSEMHQALINILMNAVQALEEQSKQGSGKITISSRRQQLYAELAISDNGDGIPESAQEQIFNPFFTTRDVGEGTGQGLTLSHDIVVRKHHGKLDFSTEAGIGTTFRLQLPLDQAD
ncbi:MAG: PhnD/SsuA/transferrin family substrate-binding protein [Candidatus Thiodiazotropha taylori]|nr:PhnD/SsuA/transferrin family substrate-binding protein [Candidatus Thiodiazotropha taylori]MCG8088713.1 PhnD/SsuA/transferrin family substrate-binding protein [Candidatus Thiodiazotropha taylori]MCW4274085.1 PhnD/SsuA/transferrin family substrate-binding protein [Candidatus Thiodiazotropha taylori]